MLSSRYWHAHIGTYALVEFPPLAGHGCHAARVLVV
jgi:hypothetical protein